MRRRRLRRGFNEVNETKRIIYISAAVVIIAILTFIITYTIFNNVLSKESQKMELSKITELSAEEYNSISKTSSSMGKSINEVIEDEQKEDTTKIAINTSNVEKTITDTTKEETKQDDRKETKGTTEEKTVATTAKDIKKEEKIPDPTFIKPVDGEIVREFAKENLVYSETLKEWITHTAIDIKAEKTTIVKASADGTIKSIKNDPRYGITVVIEHENGFTSVYSNLLTAEFVKEEEKVKQGQTIGTVGNTATFEILDEPHLHFELLKNNDYLNPSEYIK